MTNLEASLVSRDDCLIAVLKPKIKQTSMLITETLVVVLLSVPLAEFKSLLSSYLEVPHFIVETLTAVKVPIEIQLGEGPTNKIFFFFTNSQES